jgi:PIN domain nuclease of toxin-antitoxin system
MSNVVLDASALLALLFSEVGGDQVAEAINHGAIISAVNWAEVLKKAIERNVAIDLLQTDLEIVGLQILAFTPQAAFLSASLWPQTRALGLSFGDRACLALGLEQNLKVLTADTVWQSLAIGIPIQTIR